MNRKDANSEFQITDQPHSGSAKTFFASGGILFDTAQAQVARSGGTLRRDASLKSVLAFLASDLRYSKVRRVRYNKFGERVGYGKEFFA